MGRARDALRAANDAVVRRDVGSALKRIAPEAEELEAARERVGGPLEPDLPVRGWGWGLYTTHRDPVLSLFAEFAVKNESAVLLNAATTGDHRSRPSVNVTGR